MKNSIGTVLNKTGIQSALQLGKRMEECSLLDPAPYDGVTVEETREFYITGADKIGTTPIPMTLKGVAGSAKQLLAGQNIAALIDKLAERLAYERTGVRIYDLMLGKAESCQDVPEGLAEDLLEFRMEEKKHLLLLTNTIISLGADPTAMTPSADLVGVMGIGFVQTISDPRTTMGECLNVLLNVELIDNTGWELLIDLAFPFHIDTEPFQEALVEEEQHLLQVRQWMERQLFKDAGLSDLRKAG